MREVLTLLAALSIGAVCSVRAVPKEEQAAPYNGIAERNVFQLKEPPPPKVESNAAPARVPDVVLNGITTVLEKKVALMKVTAPGTTNKEIPLMLSEGQRENDVQVLEINEQSRTVRVNNAGTEMTIGFRKEAPKTSPAGSNAPVAQAQPAATASIPPPYAPSPTGPNPKTMQTRFRHEGTLGQGPATYMTNAPQGRPPIAVVPPPSAPGAAPAATATATPNQPVPLSAEEQQVLKQLESAIQQQNGTAQPGQQPAPLPQQTPPIPPLAPQ